MSPVSRHGCHPSGDIYVTRDTGVTRDMDVTRLCCIFRFGCKRQDRRTGRSKAHRAEAQAVVV